METKLPPLLAAVTDIPAIEISALRAKSRSWMSLAKVLPTIPEMDLLKIIILEMQHERRPIIITRCLTRFNTVRMERERKELFECAADVAKKILKERKRANA